MNTRTLATFRIDESQWQAFKEKSASQGSNATAELAKFIQSYISNDIQTDIQRIDDEIYNRISELSERLDQHEDRLKKLSA